ncbi:MAG TPA: ferritin-like domain-containing protein [Gemmataceae bacterium]|nr:ferritin-like domain-containing protein [Gemmataceae bacterium]
MQVVERVLPAGRPVFVLAALTFAAGVGGMAISFLFLASAHHLDVLAGAAGFIAGSVLVTGGLLSIALLRPPSSVVGSSASAPPLAVGRWLAHFRRNRENRPEPDWQAPVTLPAEVVRPLLRSLEQFQLGDGGGPAYLIARDRERFLAASEGTRALVDLWFAEEREHARLLAAAVARFGGRCIDGHWSFTAFCLSRRWFGVRFELTVLLLTEIVSTVYYRLLRRHGADPALRSLCRLILRDEIGHVAFHRDRLARAARAAGTDYGRLWEVRFRLLGLAAASMLWVNHAPGLRAIGASGAEFYRDVWLELSWFLRRLRRDLSAGTVADAPPGCN